jgi:hypothetical protein
VKLEISGKDSVTITEALKREYENNIRKSVNERRNGFTKNAEWYNDEAGLAREALVNMYKAFGYSQEGINKILTMCRENATR